MLCFSDSAVTHNTLYFSDSAVAHNADRVSLSSEFLTRQQMLSKEVQELQKSKASEVRS